MFEFIATKLYIDEFVHGNGKYNTFTPSDTIKLQQ